ncbi:MAG: SAM-dependent methyltransferase [Bacteroidota bacterium]
MTLIATAFQDRTFVKLTLSKPRSKSWPVRNLYFRPIILRGDWQFSVIWRYADRDEVKNYALHEGLELIQEQLGQPFQKAALFTLSGDVFCSVNKKGRMHLLKQAPTFKQLPNLEHNLEKQYEMDFRHKGYFKALGVLTADGEVKHDKFDKFRQVNKYVEIMHNLLENLPVRDTFKVVDMGAGSGYLSFALYDFLTTTYQWAVDFQGIELRNHLVEKGNQIARDNHLDGLTFHQGTIADHPLEDIDLLIALHACDTATDDAIVRGIHHQARVIVCAPCCHKALRASISGKGALPAIMKHGILQERQAELLTDAIRSLCLECLGYKTRVFEFISSEHTGKNLLIVAEKRQHFSDTDKQKVLEELVALKKQFGLEDYYLETALQLH